MKSLALWHVISHQYSDWEEWLNKMGNNGVLLDIEDNVSFINRNIRKAIKISYCPDDNYDFEYWNSDFDTDENRISVLNVIFKDYNQAVNLLPKIVEEFIA